MSAETAEKGGEPAPGEVRLRVEGLRVRLPGGDALIEDLTFDVRRGEVVVLLGGSGAGKSTFSRVLFERAALEEEGFSVEVKLLELENGALGLVPQRGALFDHLDVAGNLDLARRYRGAPAQAEDHDTTAHAGQWLERVGLDRSLAAAGTKVTSLSGGQAQRVAVARALAGGRKLLFLDEPSVGLDPHRVRTLARLVREQCAAGASAIVVTHDPALAGGLGDRLYMLDPKSRCAELMFPGEWPGPLEAEGVSEETRATWMARIEGELVRRIAETKVPPPPHRGRGGSYHTPLTRTLRQIAAPFGVVGSVLRRLPAQLAGRPRDFFHVALRVLRQTVARPLVFYLVVAALIGYTVLYVISKLGGAGVAPHTGIRLVGGSYIIALAPVLSAVLYVAASANATNAWIGSMGLTRQTLAMQALGVDTRAYLWAPAWLALAVGYLVVAALFAFGMLLGGLALCAQHDIAGAWQLLTADLIDPRPERSRWTVRALFLVWAYAWGIASDVVAKGAADKREADDVTHAMTRSVVACTLWVVAWELVTAVVVFAR